MYNGDKIYTLSRVAYQDWKTVITGDLQALLEYGLIWLKNANENSDPEIFIFDEHDMRIFSANKNSIILK